DQDGGRMGGIQSVASADGQSHAASPGDHGDNGAAAGAPGRYGRGGLGSGLACIRERPAGRNFDFAANDRPQEMDGDEVMSTDFGTLDAREAARPSLADRGALLVVTGLGSASYHVFAAGEHPGNFY